MLCYCGVSPLCIRGIWFHRFVYIAVTLKSVPSSIVLMRVFPSGGGGGNPHPTYAHKHGVIQFHEETCMNAWKHHTGSRVLTGGRGRETAGAFQQ